MRASTLPKVQHIIVKVLKEQEDKVPFDYTIVDGILAIEQSELGGYWYKHYMERDHFTFAYREYVMGTPGRLREYTFTVVDRQYQTIESPFTGTTGLNVITLSLDILE